MRRNASILLLVTCALLAHAQNNLFSQYAGKVLIQRQFIAGPHPVYDPDGKVLSGETGPWTTSAEIQVSKARVDGAALLIHGRRLFLLYDNETKQFRDVFDVLENSPDPQRLFQGLPRGKELQDLRDQQPVTVEIRRAAGWDDASVSAAIDRVFLASNQYVSDVASDMWKDFLCRMEKSAGRVAPCTSSAPVGTPYKVGNGIKPPRARFTPDPEYGNEARKARYQGTAVLWLIMDRDGRPEHIKIARPIGLGLDEKAADAVSRWEFDPATKDGQPVAVQINVEINFRLY